MKKVKLEEVSEIYGGYAFKSKDFGVGENFVVKIKDIKPPIIDIENADKVDVTKYSIKKMEKYKVFPDDIVIAMTGATIGKVGRNKSGRILYLNQRVAKINPNIKEDLDFIYYCISNNIFLEYVLNNLDSNSAQGNISHFGIGNFEINWYDRETRQKIAQILSCLDDKIEILHQINDNLAELAKTIYDYWFVQFDFPDENGKPYKSSGGKMVYNNVLKREIPEGWEVKRIGEFIDLERGVTYTKENISEKSFQNIGVLRATNISGNKIDLNNLVYISNKLKDSQILKQFDTLIVMSSGSKEHIGKNGIYYFSEQNAFGAFCAKIRAKEKMVFEFINVFLQSESFKVYIKNQCLGTNINNLNNTHILLCPILKPADNILELYHYNTKNIFQKIAYNTQQIQHLQSLRDWLLPMLMNGQISVE